ncbi:MULTISPECIES: hypothetical protein [Cyanophyceae]|uniref:hypothetical protein n=1 Tax=Cyanophyceae TaxID=3028117 RepID=UPI00016DCB66|nr:MULTISPECIES: hypothetical protein [Cyanophyceae]ACB00294.1 hypothetical protein SYNPCC7002_A2316 [Picosynechococcus sp. PCC 7002]SMH52568.1 hypothetical protein SAMN06272755_2491 [Picosynechococcus sp. OG1]SMQ82343.1 hypothetical protein SAMN06272774_1765 [Synechococcus sp. 7002]
MLTQLDLTGLTIEQINQLQVIVDAFKAKNQLEKITSSPQEKDILEVLTESPIEVNGFLNREEIYNR